MTRSEAAELVAMLVAAFPRTPLLEATSAVYERMLADLDHEVAQGAVARLLNTSKFFPTVAEIRAVAADLKHGPRRSGVEAWGDVLEQIRLVGYLEQPNFEDPIVAEVVKRWGWRKLCCEGNADADRARFIELYDVLSQRQRADVASGIPLGAPRVASLVEGTARICARRRNTTVSSSCCPMVSCR